jgi:hypothetical protein
VKQFLSLLQTFSLSCTHSLSHTLIHIQKYTTPHSLSYTLVHTHTHTHNTNTHSYRHTHKHTHTHTEVLTHADAHTHAHIYTRTHNYNNTRTHNYKSTTFQLKHTHAHSYIQTCTRKTNQHMSTQTHLYTTRSHALSTPANEVKLFNKWPVHDVTVTDISLVILSCFLFFSSCLSAPFPGPPPHPLPRSPLRPSLPRLPIKLSTQLSLA